MGGGLSTCQASTGKFGANFGATFGANFRDIFGNFVSNFATLFGNFVQQKGGANKSQRSEIAESEQNRNQNGLYPDPQTLAFFLWRIKQSKGNPERSKGFSLRGTPKILGQKQGLEGQGRSAQKRAEIATEINSQ